MDLSPPSNVILKALFRVGSKYSKKRSFYFRAKNLWHDYGVLFPRIKIENLLPRRDRICRTPVPYDNEAYFHQQN